jgi:branched-chain amino acid transport system permease protein
MSTITLARGASPSRLARALRRFLFAGAFLTLVAKILGGSVSLYVHGASIGVLYGLMAVGLILVYRTCRVINFAVAAIGAVPAMSGLILLASRGTNYFVALAVALIGGMAVGGVVDVLIVRRFADSPRLILTVATLGIAQGLALLALFVPAWLGSGSQSALVRTPWTGAVLSDGDSRPLVRGDQLFAIVAVLVLCGGLELFCRRTRAGIALRALADNRDRAQLLGIPVDAVQTIAWMIAGVFGAAGLFLRAPLAGIPIDATLGPGVLLFALAAASVARFDHVLVAVVTGVAAGVLEQASVARTGTGDLAYALMVGIILVTLLLRRRDQSRAQDASDTSWKGARSYTRIPAMLRRRAEIRIARWLLVAAAVGAALVAPALVSAGELGNLTTIPIFGIVAVSVVVLSGWAGQISLGQFGFVAVGAAVGGGLAANHEVDFFVALAVGTLAGALVAIVVGLPALRVQGIYLAVVTMAFAGAAQYYFLDPRYVLASSGVLPEGRSSRIQRPMLWGRVDLSDDRNFYVVTLLFLGVAVAAALALKRNRSGRVLAAARDNSRAASAYGVNVTRARLSAFAIAGGMAALAGVLLAYQQQAVDPSVYGISPSIEIFIVVVIGGLTSLSGALIATVLVEWVRLFGSSHLFSNAHLLVTGPALLAILMFLPGGVADLLFRVRDRFLRTVAARHGLAVPGRRGDGGVPPSEEPGAPVAELVLEQAT